MCVCVCMRANQLDLSHCVRIGPEGLRVLSEGCQALHTLDLTKCYNVDDDAMKVRAWLTPSSVSPTSLY